MLQRGFAVKQPSCSLTARTHNTRESYLRNQAALGERDGEARRLIAEFEKARKAVGRAVGRAAAAGAADADDKV